RHSQSGFGSGSLARRSKSTWIRGEEVTLEYASQADPTGTESTRRLAGNPPPSRRRAEQQGRLRGVAEEAGPSESVHGESHCRGGGRQACGSGSPGVVSRSWRQSRTAVRLG